MSSPSEIESDITQLLCSENLPPELEKEIYRVSKEEEIMEIFHIAERELTLNELLVAIYRKFGRIETRSNLNARLYRMSKKGLVTSVRKGVYSTTQIGDLCQN